MGSNIGLDRENYFNLFETNEAYVNLYENAI